MSQPDTPVTERVARWGPLNSESAIKRALDEAEADERDAEHQAKRAREEKNALQEMLASRRENRSASVVRGAGLRRKEESDDEEDAPTPPPPPSPMEQAPEPRVEAAAAKPAQRAPRAAAAAARPSPPTNDNDSVAKSRALVESYTFKELQRELKSRELRAAGKKQELKARLEGALVAELAAKEAVPMEEDVVEAPAPAAPPSSSTSDEEVPKRPRRRIIDPESGDEDEDEEIVEAPPPRAPAPRSSTWATVREDSSTADAVRGLFGQINKSRIGLEVCWLATNTSGPVAGVDCVLQVAAAFGGRARFSQYLTTTTDPDRDAFREHGLDAAKLESLGAVSPKVALSGLHEFLEKEGGDKRIMFVGDEGLCSRTVPILVHQMKLAGLDTTILEEAQFLDLARVAPDAIAGDVDGHNLTRDQLYERFTGQNLPRNASDANTRTFMICATMAELLKSMDWTFEAAAVTAVGADAVPGLLPSEEASSSSEEEAPRISSTRFDDAHWRGRTRNGGAWVYAQRATDLAAEWGIDVADISRLAGSSSQQPSPALAAKYEVQRLRVRSRTDCAKIRGEATRDAAFEARLDAV
jgi:hypothetical protein